MQYTPWTNRAFCCFFSQFTLSFLLSVTATYVACYKAFVTGYNDEVIYWAIPIALLTFIIFLEPLKCVLVAWSLFLAR